MNSKSVAKLAACASATLLLWVSLTSFSPAVAKNAEGFTESNTESFTEGNTERNTIGTLSELNQIEYEKHLLPSNSISAGCEYLLSKHWSAGVSFGGISTSYKKPAGWDSKYRFGIDHNGLRAKLGYYF